MLLYVEPTPESSPICVVGQRTGEHHLDPNAMAHTESTAGQDNEAGTLVPWQKLSAELVAGAWDVWPTSCIPGTAQTARAPIYNCFSTQNSSMQALMALKTRSPDLIED